MRTLFYTGQRLLLGLILAVGLSACGEQQKAEINYDPVAFHSEDECHVCGMVITDFPGPKGEAVGRDGVKKFCSTAEMLGWWLQPENQISDARLYVHDMGHSSWEHPDDDYLIDATKAWYVLGTPLAGAMGASLASFAEEQPARELAARYNGRVVQFADIDQHLLQQAAASQHAPGHESLHEDHTDHGDQAAHDHDVEHQH